MLLHGDFLYNILVKALSKINSSVIHICWHSLIATDIRSLKPYGKGKWVTKVVSWILRVKPCRTFWIVLLCNDYLSPDRNRMVKYFGRKISEVSRLEWNYSSTNLQDNSRSKVLIFMPWKVILHQIIFNTYLECLNYSLFTRNTGTTSLVQLIFPFKIKQCIHLKFNL